MSTINRRLSQHVSSLNEATAVIRSKVSKLGASSDGGVVSFKFDPLSSGTMVKVEVVLSSPSKYPNTEAALRCDSDSEVNATLQILVDRSSFALPKLLDDLFDLYGIESEGVFEALEGAEEVEGEEGEEEGRQSEYAQEEEDTVDMAEMEDRDLTIACARRHSRWERREASLSATSTASPSRSREQRLAEERQIFAPKEAFQILSNELLAMFRKGEAGEVPITADAEGDNVYQWLVRMGQLDPDSELGKDLQQLSMSTGSSTVEIRVTFTRGLHPFYPPKVELIRPRMPVVLLGAFASHPLLSLELWDPWKPCEEWLTVLKEFLQTHGSVEKNSPMNSPDDFPTSSYSPLELQLASLEAVSGIPAQAACMLGTSLIYNDREASVADKRKELQTQANKKVKRDAGGKYWAAGTGFGTSEHAYDEVWDRQRAMAVQLARDAELENLLSGLAVSLEIHLQGRGLDEPQCNPSTSSAKMISEEEQQMRTASAAFAKLIPQEQVVESVQRSCLLPLLLRELTETTFSAMGERCLYYTSCLKVIRQLCNEKTAHLLTPAGMVYPPGEKPAFAQHRLHSISAATEFLAEEAESFSKVVKRKSTEDGTGTCISTQVQNSVLPGCSIGKGWDKKSIENSEGEEAVMRLAELVQDVHAEVRIAIEPCNVSCADVAYGFVDGTSSHTSATVDGPYDSEALYCREMKPFQVLCNNFAKEFRLHKYQSERKAESFNPTTRLVRLGREIAALKSLLPLHPSSSVLVRVDEEASMMWRVMITGPEDTPYSCGCFIFDVYFPSLYPQTAPMVNLRTTAGKTVRFNPNLYKDGKVCLSLLGTWDGHKSETWDPQVSSINQVLVSIQSLIFVSEPFFNEPGYERGMGDKESQLKSKEYNRTIREATLKHAVLAQLERPDKEFADAIKTHMRLRKEKLLEQTKGWVEEANAEGVHDHACRLKQLLREVQALVEKL